MRGRPCHVDVQTVRMAGDGNAVRVDFARDQRAVGQARRAMRAALLGWRLPRLVDTVVLVTSELVTNAIRYGRPPLSVQLRRSPRQVQLDVHDGNPVELPVVLGEAAAEVESGRGLGIVLALADEVTVEQVTGDGKIIHVTFGLGQ